MERTWRRAAPSHSLVFTLEFASRSLAAGTASAYCGSQRAWAKEHFPDITDLEAQVLTIRQGLGGT